MVSLSRWIITWTSNSFKELINLDKEWIVILTFNHKIFSNLNKMINLKIPHNQMNKIQIKISHLVLLMAAITFKKDMKMMKVFIIIKNMMKVTK